MTLFYQLFECFVVVVETVVLNYCLSGFFGQDVQAAFSGPPPAITEGTDVYDEDKKNLFLIDICTKYNSLHSS